MRHLNTQAYQFWALPLVFMVFAAVRVPYELITGKAGWHTPVVVGLAIGVGVGLRAWLRRLGRRLEAMDQDARSDGA